MKPSALFALALLTSASSLTAAPKQGTDDEPPLLEKRAADAAGEIEWIDGTRIPLEGRAFSEGARPYSRLPEAARTRPDLEKVVLNMDAPVGMCFRFRTDSNVLRVRWSLRRKPPYHMANASPLLNAGTNCAFAFTREDLPVSVSNAYVTGEWNNAQSIFAVRQSLEYLTRYWSVDENPGMGNQGLYYFFDIMGLYRLGPTPLKGLVRRLLVRLQVGFAGLLRSV